MDALREYYEFVFLLDDLLGVIIGDKLLDQFNLRGAYSDVLLVSNQDSLQQLHDKQMLRSERTYDQFLQQIEQILFQKNSLGFKFHFGGDFFRQDKFRYLYQMVGEDYFCMLMKCFHIYRIDGRHNCYLQFGLQIVEEHKLPIIKQMLVDERRMCLKGNQDFCAANCQAMGALVRTTKLQNKFAENNEDKILKELKNLYGFLDEKSETVISFLVDKAKKNHLSHLRNPKITIKLHYYSCDFFDERLERERIYANLNLRETKDRFQQQFHNVNVESLLEHIFYGDQEMKSTFKRQQTMCKYVLECLNSFVINHKSCDFSSILEDACPVPEFFDNPVSDECYDPSDDLSVFCKHDEVCSYIRTVLQSVLPPQLFGPENFKPLFQWFNQIPFQNSNINLYFSNFHYKCDLKDVFWMRDQSPAFKLHAMHRLIRWLSDYVLELLRFSFYTVNEMRLRFYRFDYWMKIKSKQLGDWVRQGKIETNSYANVMESQHDLPLDLEYDIRPLFDFIQIHSTVPTGDLELTSLFTCVGTVLKAVCNDQENVFKSEIDFFNRIKSFYLNKKHLNQFSYFKLEFEDQLPNISQDLMANILGERLQRFYEKHKVEQIEIRRVAIFQKARHMKKKEVHYLNLSGLDMLDNLRLSGCWDLSNSLVNELDFSKRLAKEFVYEIAQKFIKAHRLRVNATDYLVMKDGLSFNEHLTKQLLTLYTNDLVEKSIPNLDSDQNVLVCCEDSQLIVVTTDERSARQYFNSIVRNMANYRLNFKIRHSHICNVAQLKDLGEKMSRYCNFGNFQLRIDALNLPIFHYKSLLFDVKNIKSSFSFNHWEHPDHFKTLLIESFLENFRFFNLDQSVFHSEMVMINLFNHFSLLAVQVLYFFENTLLLCRDENPKLIFEFIFDLVFNLFHQLKFQNKLIPNLKINIDFFTVLWLLVCTFSIAWRKLKISRCAEVDLLEQLKQWIKPYLKNLDELSVYDFESTWNESLNHIEFCISKATR